MFTCPMHPEIRRPAPGACPICGMTLEAETVTAEDAPNSELIDLTRRFWIGLVLTVPVFVLEMGGHLFDLHHFVPGQASNGVQFLLATPVALWAGRPFFERAWASLKSRNLNMFTLIAMGVGVAWLYSVVAVIAPGLFPPSVLRMDGSAPVYFEAAAVITVLVLLGQILELRARDHTSGAIRALIALAPETARRVAADGSDAEIPVADIGMGDRLRIRPGDKTPVDGVVLEGRSAVDESLITGESMPVTRSAGDRVVAGSLNMTGAFVMRADKVGADTLLAQIVRMVSQAQRSRAPIQRLADRVSGGLRPRRDRSRYSGGGRLGSARPRAPPVLCAAGGGVGVDHRLSLRPWARDADLDHGRRRAGRPGRRSDPRRRSPGTLREGRRSGVRQDRHSDRGAAVGDRGSGGGGLR